MNLNSNISYGTSVPQTTTTITTNTQQYSQPIVGGQQYVQTQPVGYVQTGYTQDIIGGQSIVGGQHIIGGQQYVQTQPVGYVQSGYTQDIIGGQQAGVQVQYTQNTTGQLAYPQQVNLDKTFVTSTSTTLAATHSTTMAPVVQTRVRAAIVEETVRIDRVTEVQPILHRAIDATEVHVIEKHTYETVPSMGPTTYTNQAIVQETIRPTIREEIQPIVHQNVPVTYVEQVQQHTSERVVQPTVTSKEVVSQERTLSMEEATSRGFVSAVQAQTISTVPLVSSTTAAAVTESRTRSAIVEQTTRAERITEIQPIVHREIEAPEVRVIEKHSYEKVKSVGPYTVTNQAIVQETVVPKIIEEIQPVVHRSVPAPFVERVEQHTNERVVQDTTTSREVVSQQRVGAALPAPAPVVVPSAPLVHTNVAATVVNTHLLPSQVQQTTRTEKITEIQPVVHRSIEAPEVHVIEQHSYEKVAHMGPSLITRDAIVEETIHPTLIEEIQPIVHREVGEVVVERVEQHLNERVVQPATSSREIISETKIAEAVARPVVQPRSTMPVVQSTTAAAVTESHTRSAIVEQTTRAEKVVEIQPIVHREVEAPQLHVIEKHTYETVPSNAPSMITKQAIVQETIRPTIREEIQPVVHQSVPVTFVEKVEQHTSERVIQPTISTREVLVDELPHFVQAPVTVTTAQQQTAPVSVTTTTTTTSSSQLPTSTLSKGGVSVHGVTRF